MGCRKPVGEAIWGRESKRLTTPQGPPLRIHTTPSLPQGPWACVCLSLVLRNESAKMQSENNHFLSIYYVPGALCTNLIK